MSGTSLFNSTTIASTLSRVLANFEVMYRKRAFVHQYTEEGMDLSEFDEAAMCVKDLISEYQQYQEMQCEGKDMDEEDDGIDMMSAGEMTTRPQTAMSEDSSSKK
jgi:tubulin beta